MIVWWIYLAEWNFLVEICFSHSLEKWCRKEEESDLGRNGHMLTACQGHRDRILAKIHLLLKLSYEPCTDSSNHWHEFNWEIEIGWKPSIKHLRTFGCVSWVHISDNCRKKMYAKSHSFIMMGYSDDSKSYRWFFPLKQ